MPLSRDGTFIYADAVGDPSYPALVFVHGVNLSAIVWDGLFSHRTLKENFYMVRIITTMSRRAERRRATMRHARFDTISAGTEGVGNLRQLKSTPPCDKHRTSLQLWKNYRLRSRF